VRIVVDAARGIGMPTFSSHSIAFFRASRRDRTAMKLQAPRRSALNFVGASLRDAHPIADEEECCLLEIKDLAPASSAPTTESCAPSHGLSFSLDRGGTLGIVASPARKERDQPVDLRRSATRAIAFGLGNLRRQDLDQALSGDAEDRATRSPFFQDR